MASTKPFFRSEETPDNKPDRDYKSGNKNTYKNKTNNYTKSNYVSKPKNCNFCENLGKDGSGHISRDCPMLKSTICKRCSNIGHTTRYCETPKCSRCSGFGHWGQDCKVCLFCWNRNVEMKDALHLVKECPLLKEYVCELCYEAGHTERFCQAPVPEVSQQEFQNAVSEENMMPPRPFVEKSERFCKLCTEKGHFASRCPYVYQDSKRETQYTIQLL
jgi:hypothetical protein